jgi:DNA-binding LacI/PurR family transcriptional regulator
MAIGAMSAALEAGLCVPDDLSVVGFDDIHLAGYVNPPLTTVAQPKFELGRVAARMLLERIDQRALAPRRRLLPTQLVVRHSTAACAVLQH